MRPEDLRIEVTEAGLPDCSLRVGGQDQHLPPIELGQALSADGAGEGRGIGVGEDKDSFEWSLPGSYSRRQRVPLGVSGHGKGGVLHVASAVIIPFCSKHRRPHRVSGIRGVGVLSCLPGQSEKFTKENWIKLEELIAEVMEFKPKVLY